jgi:alpha-tubulin suppressor-like RCC1 family protein
MARAIGRSNIASITLRAFAAVVVAAGTVAVSATSAAAAGAITVTPDAGLVDGQAVEVAGTGWEPGHTVGVCQGVLLTPASQDNCDDGDYTVVIVDSAGAFTVELTIRRTMYVPALATTVDCTDGAAACVVGAADAIDVAGTGTTVPIALAPAPPGAPTILRNATAGDQQATVSWLAPESDGGSPITGYVVTPYVGYAPRPPTSFSSTDTTQVITGLLNGTQYRFRVQAVNAVGTSGFSTVTNPVTPGGPDAPTIGTAIAEDGAATLSWTAPAYEGLSPITGYAVTPYIGFFPLAPISFASTDTTQVVGGLTNGTTYRFAVAATNAFGTGSQSAVSNPVTPTVLSVPGAPMILRTAWPGNGEATVSWLAPTSDGGRPITAYVVTPYIGYKARPSTTFMSTETTQVVTGLTNGTQYRFRVRAVNVIGTSEFSKATNPVVPTDVPIAGSATAVGGGESHSCAVVVGGAVMCWGSNYRGQLGNGSFIDSTIPVQVTGITGATAVAGGRSHTCALVAGGEVRCWGLNDAGQLGDGTFVSSNLPVAVTGITGATEIAIGDDHSCALVAGTVRCWGTGYEGQLGHGVYILASPFGSATPVTAVGITDATSVVADTDHTCALLADGTVQCWGWNGAGQVGPGAGYSTNVPVAVTGLTGVTALGAGSLHTCAVVAAGGVKCWGYNDAGQLGNGTLTSSSSPVTVVGLTDAARLELGRGHSCALLTSGTVRCWGMGSHGQLGIGTYDGWLTAAPPTGLTDVVQLTAGDVHTCAVVATGAAYCWGGNLSYQLGNGTTETRANTPTRVSGI